MPEVGRPRGALAGRLAWLLGDTPWDMWHEQVTAAPAYRWPCSTPAPFTAVPLHGPAAPPCPLSLLLRAARGGCQSLSCYCSLQDMPRLE